MKPKLFLIILVIIICIYMTDSLSYSWSGDPWGPISRSHITAIASEMIYNNWSPKSNIHNWAHA